MNSTGNKLKYSSLMADWLIELGYTHCFYLAGGGCMHLIDGFRGKFICIPVVHEYTAGIAAEHFNECSAKGRAFVLVTTGPGLTNILTAVAGCFVEHRELLIIAGQVKSTDRHNGNCRQHGVQEIDGAALCSPISVVSRCLTEPVSRSIFTDLVRLAWGPDPGPVVIEVCLDVQGATVDRCDYEPQSDEVAADCDELSEKTLEFLSVVRHVLSSSARPVFLIGGLLKRTTIWPLISVLESLGIPVLTTTAATDRMSSSCSVYGGRVGTWGGQRSANLILAQADLVVAIGAQLDLQQTGFDQRNFAPQAEVFQIFPEADVLSSRFPGISRTLACDPNTVFSSLVHELTWSDSIGWLNYARLIRSMVPVMESANAANPEYVLSFTFLRMLSLAACNEDMLAICSSGGTFTGALQVYEVAPNQYASTSPALASMGYGLATAIGMSFSHPERTVILTEGDGGFCQNLQDLATIVRNNLPIKIFILDNDGYASIRATQRKFFGGAYVGCDTETGLGFPDWIQLFSSYGIVCRNLALDEINIASLDSILHSNKEPEAWIVKVDPEQSNWPSVTSQLLSDGRMISSPISSLAPTLPDDVAGKVTRFLRYHSPQ